MIGKCRVASVAALLVACSGTTSEQAAENQSINRISAADSGACADGSTMSGWVDGMIGPNSGSFSVDLDATPGSGDEDALFGLAASAPGTYSDLAAIVRFNAQGKLDARDGDAYRAASELAYAPGVTRHLHFAVDGENHRYSVTDVTREESVTIADDFAFRTEQANAASLGAYGVKVDAGGALDVCNVIAQNQSCATAGAQDGFQNAGFAPQNTFLTLAFDATPSASNIDAVVGVSASPATSFDDIAAIVRFNPNGMIDARDGEVYRVVGANPQPYRAGTSYHIVLLIDVLAHTYTVVVNGQDIAQGLAFRTPQSSASSLGNLVLESDGASGSVSRCSTAIAPARDASYMHGTNLSGSELVPLPDGRLLVPQATQALVFDPAGFQVGTAPVASPLAVDAAGNLYHTGTFSGTFDAGTGPLTSAGGVDAYVVKYDTSFNPVWSERFGGASDDTVSAPSVNARGDVLFVLDQNLVRIDSDGKVVYDSVAVSSGSRVALAPDGSVFANDDPPVSNTLSITKLDPSGNSVWTHGMPIVEGGVNIQAVGADATGGVVFAGEIDGKFAPSDGTTFTLEAGEDGEQTYVGKLDGNGGVVYVNATNISSFQALALDGLGNAAVSGTHENAFVARIDEYGPDGSQLREVSNETLIPLLGFGTGSAAASDATGNLYWRFDLGPADYGDFLVKVRAP